MSASTITLLFLLLAVVIFVWEKIPLAVTAMTVCIGLALSSVLDVKTAFLGFIDSNGILFVASSLSALLYLKPAWQIKSEA